MEQIYNIVFDNKIPTWEEMKIDNYKNNETFPEIEIFMMVYKKEKVIYSIKLKIKGHYYSCGVNTFEFDKIEKIMVKKCDYSIVKSIYNELKNNYKNVFDNSLLDFYKTEIFEYLCEY